MSRRLVMVLAASLFTLMAMRARAQEPTAFREIPFGAAEDEIRAKYPGMKCNPILDDVTCRVEGLTIGDVSIRVLFTLVSEADGAAAKRKLAQVLIGFTSKDYDLMKEAFVAKYGQPTGKSEVAGLLWEGARWSAFVMREQKGRPGEGLAAVATPEYRALVSKRQREKQQEQRRKEEERLERARKGL